MESKKFECLACGKDKKQKRELDYHINGNACNNKNIIKYA